MRKCIICGSIKNDNKFNIEHIIPEALGNKSLKINEVCIECNSKMGSKVDKYITTGFLMDIFRNNYKVGGKNNKIPFPFIDGIDKDGIDEDGNKVKLNHNFKPILVTNVEETDNKYKIKTSSKENAMKIVKTIYEKNGLNFSQEEIISKLENTKNESIHPTISYECKINFNELELAILKIAYEYACLKLGTTYYDDKCGSEIRRVIQKAINGDKVEKYNSIFNLSNKMEVGKNIMFLGEQFNNAHFLQMQKVNNDILLTISLFCEMSLSYIIHISKNANRYDNANFTEFVKLNRM